ncbi:LVIVD repeat-containing protein [Micromonospora sp. SL4-19]|uniref:LVIVD repeat-containing protein n=1 Tax=Micromonospora sp. SL4-19 TaxID=3399129 RepID=UPI003A4D6221
MKTKPFVAGAVALATAVAVQLGGAGAASAAEPPGSSPSDNSAHGGAVLDDVHNTPTTAVAKNVTFIDNVKGVSGYSALNFIKYDKYGHDFMFANGTGGLAVWSLKDPQHPALVSKITAAELRLPGDTQDRFWEGENMTVDPKRKLVFLIRDPRGFGGTVKTGQSGVYIVDVKNPWKPEVVTFHPIPAGHTSTCINDCKYLWSVGPANTGTPGHDPSWNGVPVRVTDIHDIKHPYTFDRAVDLERLDGVTDYVHSVDVDKDGVAWVSGEGGVRGYWTEGNHYDPVQKRNRVATAYDPVPYAGGTVVPINPAGTAFYDFFDHNAYHPTEKVGDFDKGELLYITNENVTTCSQAGEFKIASLKGSYDGEGWRSTKENPFRLELISHWSPWGKEGSSTTGSCSAHWFTVNGNIVAQGWYGQGTRFLDVSDPRNPTQVGYFRVPAGQGVTGGSASAVYWHNGLVYVADYNRGVDVLRFDGELAGAPDDKICWNSCDK